MTKCPHPKKLHHATKRAALDQLMAARRASNHPGGGHSLNSLNVYLCQCRFGWCIGRSSRDPKTVLEKTAPEPKPKTLSEIRRYVKRLEVQMDNYRKHRAYLVGQLVAADKAKADLEQELLDIQDAALKELGYLKG